MCVDQIARFIIEANRCTLFYVKKREFLNLSRVIKHKFKFTAVSVIIGTPNAAGLFQDQGFSEIICCQICFVIRRILCIDNDSTIRVTRRVCSANGKAL